MLSQFDADPLIGLRDDPAGRENLVRTTVVSTLAYNQFAAPPIFSDGGGSEGIVPNLVRGERLPAPMLVFITDSRDAPEYQVPYPDVPAGTVADAAARMRQWPQQFNHERWAVAAQRTGLYEYIEGHQFAVPRIYTDKLQRAIVQGIKRFNLRAFVSETNAATGITGPMLWELAQVLWDPQVDVSEQRLDFCGRSFGLAGDAMKRFFDLAERTWHSTRSDEVRYFSASPMSAPGIAHAAPDRRSRGQDGNGYFGQGYVGRAAVMSQFAGLYRDIELADGTRAPALDQLWRLLEAAKRAEPATSEAGRRVQMFRRAFGFTRMIAQWYHPLHRAFEIIRAGSRERASPMNNLVNPASLTYNGDVALTEPRSDVPVVALGDAALIAAVRSRIGLPYSLGTPLNVPGVFWLRMRVHEYLTQDDLQTTTAENDWSMPIPSGGDLGFAVLSPVRTDEGAVLLDNRPEAAARQVGLYLPEWKQYAAWWNDPRVRGEAAMFDRRAFFGSTMRGGVTLEASLIQGYASLNWILSQIGLMARAVVLYGGGVTGPDELRSESLLRAIFQG